MPPKQLSVADSRSVVAAIDVLRRTKIRAHIACQVCRARKVRCDVAENGAPCTNCKLDKIECAVIQRHRVRLVTFHLSEFSFLMNERGIKEYVDVENRENPPLRPHSMMILSRP